MKNSSRWMEILGVGRDGRIFDGGIMARIKQGQGRNNFDKIKAKLNLKLMIGANKKET